MSQGFKETFDRGWNAFVGRMGLLAEQRHFAALRDGFALMVPLIIASSFGVLGMTFVFGWWDTTSVSILGWIALAIPGQTYEVFTTVDGVPEFLKLAFVPGSVASEISAVGTAIFYTIWNGVFSFISLFVALTLSYSMARIKKVKDPFIGSLVGLAAFLILVYGSAGHFSATGMLVAIFASLLSMELYSKFEASEKLELKMPNGVPPAVARAFSKLLPTIFTLLIMVALQAPFMIFAAIGFANIPIGTFGLGHAIAQAIQAPFMQMVSDPNASLGIGLSYTFFMALLWFFGIHGSNVLMGVFGPIAILLLAQNQGILTGDPEYAGKQVSAFADGTWDAFIMFGGTGSTLALVLITLTISKIKAHREVVKFGGAAAIFNINEPLLFGIPLILNFSFAVPFLLIQPLLYFTTWLCIEAWAIVPAVIVKIPWTTPLGLGGFLATASWQGVLLALFNFTVACFVYLPFVLLANRKAVKNGEELVKIDYKGGWGKIVAKIKKDDSHLYTQAVQNEQIGGEG